MTYQTCPTDVVEASSARVWELVANPANFSEWLPEPVLTGPARSLEAGDRVVLGAGPAQLLRVIWVIHSVVPSESLAMDVLLPFGLVNHEVVQIREMGAERCRVTLN